MDPIRSHYDEYEPSLGIILCPTVLGNIPNFTNKIFPQMSAKTADDPDVTIKSFDTFYVVANVGLIFFMFLMGLEWDAKEVKRLWKHSFPIASMSIIGVTHRRYFTHRYDFIVY